MRTYVPTTPIIIVHLQVYFRPIQAFWEISEFQKLIIPKIIYI